MQIGPSYTAVNRQKFSHIFFTLLVNFSWDTKERKLKPEMVVNWGRSQMAISVQNSSVDASVSEIADVMKICLHDVTCKPTIAVDHISDNVPKHTKERM